MRNAAIACFLWLAALLAMTDAARAAAPVIPDDLVTARLIPESDAVGPGQTLWVDLHLDVKPGWHIYWRDPGDSGLPTAIEWHLPAGFSAGEIAWPAPERFIVGTLANYGYTGKADLLIPVTAPTTLDTAGRVSLEGIASWLVCSEICIPGEAKLSAPLSATAAAAPAAPDRVERFAAFRRAIPAPAAFETGFLLTPDKLRLQVPAAALAGMRAPQAAFFPYDANLIDNAAEQRVEHGGDGLVLTLARPAQAAGQPAGPAPTTVDGVLVFRDGAGAGRSFAISANPAPIAAAADTGLAVGWWQAVAFAFLGGLILNLMPCVFPVLSLKILSLAGLGDRTARRQHGVAYAAGVVLSFLALGGVLLGVRAGGAAIGWGFQLQSPLFVGVLAYLLFAMGLSLSGVAEFGVGMAGLGSRWAERSGLAGAFATGVLATVVATPCTAPFMATALGAALLAPWPLALAIFFALAAGLAAPFLLVALLPGVGRILPRPGAWMAVFKQALAFPLYGTVAWLVWVLLQQVGPRDSLAILFGLVCVGFAVWVYGRTQLAAPAGRRLGLGLAAIGMIAAVVLATTMNPAGAVSGGKTRAAGEGLSYETFDADRLASLAAEHKPAFVNLTAAWCLTCLLNEQATLDSSAVQQAFAKQGIIAMKGDWTRQNPAITAFLQTFGRSGVPLYLLYDRNGKATVLPQILTEAGVLDAVGRLGKPG